MAWQTLPVSIETYIYQKKGTTIYFPQMIHHPNTHVQKSINQALEHTALELIRIQQQKQGVNEFNEMIGFYEIKTNERNVLSILFSNYAIHEHFAHGLTIMKSLTFDVLTGQVFDLSDLFVSESGYLQKLSNIIQTQIKERNIPMLNDVENVIVTPDQDYYIADKALVIYFQLYDITPYYVGLPMFPISVYKLQDDILENGVLGRMLK